MEMMVKDNNRDIEINTLEDAGKAILNAGLVDFENETTVEGKQLVEFCGFSTGSELKDNSKLVIDRQIKRHNLVEGVDFSVNIVVDGRNRKTIYRFSMNAANHILLAAMTNKGRNARQEAINVVNGSNATQLPNFNDPAAAARAWAEQFEANRELAIDNLTQSAQIEHLESHFKDGCSIVMFCKQLNGVNIQRVNSMLEGRWLYDANSRFGGRRGKSWRVTSRGRDFLREESRQEYNGERNINVFTVTLLARGKKALYKKYLNNELPMNATWDGKFTHETEVNW